ncbi:MAG TPA: GNAT family N-acetyltransferase [Lacipirellulaceae bacterium]|jgi:RimJ/RimL family protein N-acetyltransferase
MSKVILQTARLALREMTWDDLDFVATMLADPQVMRYYPKCYSRDEAKAWVQKQLNRYRDNGHGLWLAINCQTSEPIGQVGLVRQEVEGAQELEIGYLIHHPHWRQGYATEAAAAVRDYTFDELGHERVGTLIRPVNIPSQRVAVRIGLKPEKLVMFRDYEHLVFSMSRPAATGRPA